jgi:hypothetical protein
VGGPGAFRDQGQFFCQRHIVPPVLEPLRKLTIIRNSPAGPHKRRGGEETSYRRSTATAADLCMGRHSDE